MEREEAEEEDNQVAGGTESKDDASQLKSNFDEQQQMIGQLEAISKAHEKGMEDYTLRLAMMKPRLLRGRGRGRETARAVETLKSQAAVELHSELLPIKDEESAESIWPVETLDLPHEIYRPKPKNEPDQESDLPVLVELIETPLQVPSVDSSHSKVLLLRKQLEQNRVKFDRQQKENIDKRLALQQMKNRVERLTLEVDDRDQLIISLQQGDTSAADPGAHILYQQILHKDNTILDLSEKVSQLEMHIQDQREQMAEKEQVISAKNEAVILVAKDRDKKLQQTVNQLEEVTISMHRWQTQCESNEADWQSKQTLLNEIISEREKKILTLEQNSRRTETVRFQVTARNAELQDKLVALQTELQVTNSKLEMTERKVTDKNEDISELNKKVSRAEAFGQKKLKIFEKYFKSVEQDDLGERILTLTNDIAILEEEKGNLQLKLVDCDEILVSNEKLLAENLHLGTKYDNMSFELKSVSDLVTDLEKEKIVLLDSLNEINLEKHILCDQLTALGKELEEKKRINIALELSSCRLEEEKDIALNQLEKLQTKDNKSEFNSDNLMKDKVALQQLLHDRDSEMTLLHTTIKNLQLEHDRKIDIAEVDEQREQNKQQEADSLLQLLTNKEEFIMEQSIELSDIKEVLTDFESKLNSLRNMEDKYKDKIESLEEHVSQGKHSMDQLRKEVVSYQNEASLDKENNSSLQNDVIELKKKLEQSIECINRLQNTISILEAQLQTANNCIESKNCELEQNCNKVTQLLEQLRIIEAQYKDNCIECKAIKDNLIAHQDKSNQVTTILREELNTASQLILQRKHEITSLKSEAEINGSQIKKQEMMISKYEQENCQLSPKINELTDLNVGLESELNVMSAMLTDKDNKICTLSSQIEVKDRQIDNNQLMISNFESENCANNLKIDTLIDQRLISESEIKCLKDKVEGYQSSIQTHIKETKDLQNLMIEKESSVLSLNAEIESSTIISSKLLIELEESKSNNFSLQEKNEGLKIQIESMKLKCHETRSEMESIKFNYEKEIVLLRQDVVDKQSQIAYVENEIELSNDRKQIEHKTILEKSSDQIVALQQNSRELESKIADLSNQLDEKDTQIKSLETILNERSIEYSDASSKLIVNNEQIDSLNSQLALTVKQYEDLLMKVERIETEKLRLSNEIDNISLQLTKAEISNNKITNELCNLKLTSDSSNLIETKSSHDLSRAIADNDQICLLQNQYENVSQQKLKLERELLEAQQAIVRLETSLGMHSSQDDNSKAGSSDWGDVDLGQKNEYEPSLQTTLLEKDRILTMTQEQLKDALEQVNTVVDDKKQTDHKMKVLEAELQHKQKEIHVQLEQIQSLQMSVDTFQDQCTELQQKAIAYDEKSKRDAIEGNFVTHQIRSHTELDQLQSSTLQDSPISNYSPSIMDIKFTEKADSEIISLDTAESSKALLSLDEVRYKLNWYEEIWPQWSQNYNQMCFAYQTAQEQISLLQRHLNDEVKPLEREDNLKASLDVHSKKDTRADMEYQNEGNTTQNQIGLLEKNLSEMKLECERLRPLEVLCSELETNIQELESKGDGTSARISELELMVESAESEISRLRSDMQSLTNAGSSLENETSCLKEEITNLNEEIRKINTERERVSCENTKMQEQAAIQLTTTAHLQDTNQRLCSENLQLTSEIEVLEGDADRGRVSWEFLEAETNRFRAENDILVQNGQVLEAEKESLAQELQRICNQLAILILERDHLKGEAQRLLELSTSAESEITRLKIHLETLNDLTIRYQQLENQYSELQSNIADMEVVDNSRIQSNLIVEEIDWSAEGNLEKEHFQSSQQTQEISLLKEQICRLEKKKSSLGDELYAAKLKNGKMIQKLKAANTKIELLQKKVEKFNEKGHDDLDAAIEAEWKTQITKAESERDEYKIKADLLEKEKYNFINQIDVLHSAQEKYFELKEHQDLKQVQLNDRNKFLGTQVSSMEWRIAELEETLEEKSVEKPQSEDVSSLTSKIYDLEKNIQQLSLENTEINIEKEEIKRKLEEAEIGCEKLRIMFSEMRGSKDKLANDCEKYKKTYLELYSEHENLIDTQMKSSSQLAVIERELNTVKFSYDSICNEYNDLQLDRDTVKYELGILSGERDKIQEELNSVNNIQMALKEEEKETIIISLQDECSFQRQQNNDLKDEIAEFGELVRQAEEESNRAKQTLEQQLDIQELVRNDLNEKILELNYLNTTHESQEKNIKYERAEVAALKCQVAQLKEALEQSLYQQTELQTKLKQLQVHKTSTNEVEGSSVLPQRSAQSADSLIDDVDLTDALNDRCRQMSLEINKLLEERDSLQLKLSSSLRQNQELSRELSLSQQLPTPPPPTALKKKLSELRELNSSLEEKAMSSLTVSPPTMPTFVSRTAPPTPTASRELDIRLARDTEGSPGLVGWILGRGPQKEVLHV